jgi:dihydroorotate dehydrogenase electron transfer subunit
MRSYIAEIRESSSLYGNTHILWINNPTEIYMIPGQFLMIYIGDSYAPLLGRALSIHRLRNNRDDQEFALLFEVVGQGTHWLSQRSPGEKIRFVGPLGNGFNIEPKIQRTLLVGGGIGCAPLVWLADDLSKQGKDVTLLLGGRTKKQIFPPELLPPSVEVIATTEDGSFGQKGLLTSPFKDLLLWSDQVFSCGPKPMFEAMYGILRESGSSKSIQILMEEHMACGFGICYSCAVFPQKGGVKLVCSDGPMFDIREIYA